MISSFNPVYLSQTTAFAYDDFESYVDGATLDGLNGGAGWAGPYVARAGNVIKGRNYNSIGDNAAQITNSNWARKVYIPPSWNVIRLGIKFHTTSTGANLTPTTTLGFWMGLCSGTTAIKGDAIPKHFLGVRVQATGDWVFNGGNPRYILTNGTTTVYETTVGATIATTDASIGMVICANADGVSPDRTGLILEITKGFPNYSLRLLAIGGNASVDYPTNIGTFLRKMRMKDLDLIDTNSLQITAFKTIAIDEPTNGFFDSVNFYWNLSAISAEICNLSFAVVS